MNMNTRTPGNVRDGPSGRFPRTAYEPSATAALCNLRGIIERERRARRPRACRVAAVGLRDVLLEAALAQRVPCVALYVSRTDEPGTEPLRRHLRMAGISVLLPAFGSDGTRWFLDTGPSRSLARPRTGRATPHRPARQTESDEQRLTDAALIVVPALAVDTMGHRLGRATPSYREALRSADPRTPVLAAVFDTELFDAAVEPVPVEPSGITVDQVVTPTRILRLDRCPSPHRRRSADRPPHDPDEGTT